jgi:hypothetical protein
MENSFVESTRRSRRLAGTGAERDWKRQVSFQMRRRRKEFPNSAEGALRPRRIGGGSLSQQAAPMMVTRAAAIHERDEEFFRRLA